ncbi:MAG: glycosyltransferase family 4 protein [Elusimicrobia bacterium]|nr:glycosyltransferase family 4 protein [Elusimicrobiota bacterium]
MNSVLMLISNFYPAVGGAEKQALEISVSLKLRGINVTALTRRINGAVSEENLKGIFVKRLPVIGSGIVDSVFFMLEAFFYLLFHARDYGIIHVHLASSPAVAALIAGKILGKKVIIKLGGGRGVDEITLSMKTLSGRMKLAFFRIMKPDMLIMNDETFEWLKNTGEFSGLRLTRFRNGVDTGRYSPVSYSEKISAKHKLRLENKTVFLFVGRLSPEKRIVEFVEAWGEILAEELVKPGIHLALVGKGPEEKKIKDAVEKLNLRESVSMFGQQIELLPYYQAADVFILPSVSEGLSNSMLEAMSCGLAIMASRTGGAKEAVEEGVNGFLFDPFNRQDEKRIIKLFAGDRNLAVKMGEKSREIAVKEYSMSKVTDELIKIYQK